MLGDIILAVGGVKVQSYEDLLTEIEKFSVGSEIILTILRESKLFDDPSGSQLSIKFLAKGSCMRQHTHSTLNSCSNFPIL